MVSLLDLPTEILEEIATHIRPQSNLPRDRPWPNVADPRDVPVDLLNFCRTCRLLRDIAQPIIFRSIHAFYQGSHRGSAFGALSQTLQLRPFLAEKVKSLALSISMSNLANQADEKYTWEADLPALALIMLGLLSNLTSLHVFGSTFLPPQDPSHLGRLISISRLSGEPVLLPCLRALYVSPEDGDEGFVRITNLVRFFGHAGLRKVSIYSGALLDYLPFWNNMSELDTLESGSLHISKLNLLGCLLDQRSLRKLLQGCANLKSFRYSQMDNDMHDIHDSLELDDEPLRTHFDQHPLMTPSTISFALEPCKDSLEDLRISFYGTYGTPPDTIKFSMLRDFKCFAFLDIEARHLHRFSDLPSSLEHLTLRSFCTYSPPAKSLPPDFAEFVERIADPEQTGWPSLKSVYMEGALDEEIWGKETLIHRLQQVGTWEFHGPGDSPCCLVWPAGGVELTLSNPTLHWNRPGVIHPRWKIVDDDDSYM